MKYRKKPVEVEAWQISGLHDFPEGVPRWLRTIKKVIWHRNYIQIITLEGIMRAKPGDWIVRGVKGELYPVRDDIFRDTYELVGSER